MPSGPVNRSAVTFRNVQVAIVLTAAANKFVHVLMLEAVSDVDAGYLLHPLDPTFCVSLDLRHPQRWRQ